MFKELIQKLKALLVAKVKEAMPMLEDYIMEQIKVLLEKAEEYLAGDTFEEAKVKLIDDVFEKISLPWFAKPFKGLIKKEIAKSLDSTLDNVLRQVKEKLSK